MFKTFLIFQEGAKRSLFIWATSFLALIDIMTGTQNVRLGISSSEVLGNFEKHLS